MADRHRRLWEWFEQLLPGQKPRAQVEAWARGGAKSSTAELCVARVGTKLTRRFALYVSGTQEQADLHIQSIGTAFEQIGLGRAVNRYGTSKGWRRNQLRAENGFNVAAYGLDAAVRGIKIDQYRPDLIIFDDIDAVEDTPKTVGKKIDAITSKILPTGSSDCAVIFIQNLIHEEGIVARLVDGRAGFLMDRNACAPEPAVEGLAVEIEELPDGASRWKIVGGKATWDGQSLETCEKQINEWGLATFLREAQHEVAGADGYVFNPSMIRMVDRLPSDLKGWKFCRGHDLAATHGAGDYTALVLIGLAPNGTVWIVDVVRGQWSSEKVRTTVAQTAQRDVDARGKVFIRLPQDPGQAGKDQREQYEKLLVEFGSSVKFERPTGSKAGRAEGLANAMNSGNMFMIRAPWNEDFKAEARKFREDETHEFDDQIDAAADAYNELVGKRPWWREVRSQAEPEP